MPPPHDGNEFRPFVELMGLEKINEVTYRSTALPFSPNGTGRSYGGHVFAQAVWAAAHTVKDGFVVHNATGFFILAGISSVPFVYKVHSIRDGGSYCTRIVNVTQAEGKGICFTCTCSFKRAESSPLNEQEHVDVWKKYKVVLEGTKPEDFEQVPGVDVPWYWKQRRETGHNDAFPGLDMRKVAMDAYNSPRHALDRRQLMYYRAIGSLPSDANLHACAHLYASDRNSLYIVANHFDVGDKWTQMGSLSHTVVFHVPVEDMRMVWDETWFVKEDWTTRAAGGRAMYHSRLLAPDGTHVATSLQEGMIRLGSKPRGKL